MDTDDTDNTPDLDAPIPDDTALLDRLMDGLRELDALAHAAASLLEYLPRPVDDPSRRAVARLTALVATLARMIAALLDEAEATAGDTGAA